MPGLPRLPDTFTNGAFGPLAPILPVPVDMPEEDTGYAEARLQEYQVGWNLPVGTPGAEGIKLTDFGTLKTLADLYSVARACIQLRKSEIRGIEWDILPTRDASKAMRGSPSLARSFGARRAEAIRFFKRPDPDFFNWSSFLDALSEEVFVFDALSLLIRPKWARGNGLGLLGSDLDSLSLISGPTIRPLFGMHGERPRPPAPAYQQYLYGVPRTDLMSLITERDLESGQLTGSEMGQFQADQLLYLPMVARRWTPYGFPPIERALIPVLSGLQKQGFQYDYYREGSVPAVYISPGGANANMTPNQIRELQDALNAIAGDPAWKHKIIVLPADSKVMPQKQTELADQFDEIVMNQVCMAFDVQPMELGIMPKVSTTVSPGAANQMSKASQTIHDRKATKPFLSFVSDIMNVILQEVAGQSDMRFMFEGLEEGDDEATKTKTLIDQVGAALRSIDEAREELDLQPWGLPETSDPGWATATGWTPLTEAVAAARSGTEEGSVFVDPAGAITGDTAPDSAGASASGGAGTPVPDQPEAANGEPTPPTVPGIQAEPGSPQAPSDPTMATPAGGVQIPGHAAAEAAAPDVPSAMAKGFKGPHKDFQERRATRVEKHSAKVEERLSELVEGVRDGKIDRNKAVALGVTVLAAGYADIVDKAINDADSDLGLNLDSRDHRLGTDVAWRESEKQRQWLDGLIQKAIDDPNKKLKGRISAYARSLQAVYNRMYVNTAKGTGQDWRITWRLGPTEHCDSCIERDGKQYDLNTLPGIPGDGGFDDICAGGPKCGCSLEFEEADRKDADVNPVKNPGKIDTLDLKDLHERVAELANSRMQVVGKHPAQLLKPEDISETDVQQIFASKTRAILSELEAMTRHVKKGRLVSEWEPRHLSSDVLARVNEYIAKGADVETASQMVRQQRLVSTDGVEYWADLIGDWRPGQISEGRGGGYEKRPHDVNDIQVASKGASDLDDPNPVAAEHVENMMMGDFKPSGIKWIKDTQWVGPIKVEPDRVDQDDIDGWAASHEPEKIARFVKMLEKGKKIKPAISIRQTEGDSRIKIVDGHHRFLAYKQVDEPFITYLGFVPEGDDRWESTHSYQLAKDGKPSESAHAVKSHGEGEKVSKESVNYRPADDPNQRCGNCSMFTSETNTCTLVDGAIRAIDVCDEWDPVDTNKALAPQALAAPSQTIPVQTPQEPLDEETMMADPTLIDFFETGDGASQIKWGTTGDISRCVTLATQSLGLENAQQFCQVRYAKMTGQTASGLIHQSPDAGAGGGS
jgi:hypothetical protein